MPTSTNNTTEEENSRIEYTVELAGDQYDHSSFREQVHEHNGEITNEQSTESPPQYIQNAVRAVKKEQETPTRIAIEETAYEIISDATTDPTADGRSVFTVLADLAELETLSTNQLNELATGHQKWSDPNTHETAEAHLKAIAQASLERHIKTEV